MTKTFHDQTLFGFSNFGNWKLFDICDFNNSMNSQQRRALRPRIFTSPGRVVPIFQRKRSSPRVFFFFSWKIHLWDTPRPTTPKL